MRKVIKNWEEVIEQHRQSGKSVENFCKEIGIHSNTFYKNRQKRRRSEGSKSQTAVIEIKPTALTAAAPIVLKTKKFMISISNGFDESQLKSVLRIIGELE